MSTFIVPATGLRVFVLYEEKQALAFHTLSQALLSLSSIPLSITPLNAKTLPLKRDTQQTASEYLVPYLTPWLCDFQGHALYLHYNTLPLVDIAELLRHIDGDKTVTLASSQHRIARSGIIFFNNAKCESLTLENVSKADLMSLHDAKWALETAELPPEWHHCVGYDTPATEPKLVYYLQGHPGFPECADSEYANEWQAFAKQTQHVGAWFKRMQATPHYLTFQGETFPKYKAESRRAAYLDEAQTLLDTQQYTRPAPSPKYLELLSYYKTMHTDGDGVRGPELTYAGSSLVKEAESIRVLFNEYPVQTVLDYGSGKGGQYDNVKVRLPDGSEFNSITDYWGGVEVTCYDPAFAPFSNLPKGQFDAVICTDVLEHCPLEDIPWILDELFSYAKTCVYATVAAYPAVRILPNGENAHCSLRPTFWWGEIFSEMARKYPHLHFHIYLQESFIGPNHLIRA